jgi:microcystin-dependent protein
MELLFANNAQSTLAGSITDSALTANLQSGTGVRFPSPSVGVQYFVGTLTDAATGLLNEVVHVTQVVGDTITMIRAQEGTVALAWSANDLFAELWTAGQCETMVQEGQAQAQEYNYAVDTGIANTYQCELNPQLVDHVPGMPITVLIGNDNSGASTFDPGPGPISIRRRDGSTLKGLELLEGDLVTFRYNSDDNHYYISNGAAPATAALVSAGVDEESFITPAQLANASFSPTGSVIPFAGLTIPSGWAACRGQAINRTTFAALFAALTASATVTITIANPAVVSWTSHGLKIGATVSFETTGALPTGLSVGTNYYVIAAGFTANSFRVSTTPTGSAVITTGSQSGVQTGRHNPFGCGNGTTTFNVPDLRGRAAVGDDSMDGSAASRIGSGATGGITGPGVAGQSGGEQSHVLTVAELAAHTHQYVNMTNTNVTDPVQAGGWKQDAVTPLIATASTGSDAAHNTVQPSLILTYYIIKT